MKPFVAIVFTLVLAAGAAIAMDFVGYVPGQLIVEMEPGTHPVAAKSADGLRVDLTALDAVLQRHAAMGFERLHPVLKHTAKAGGYDLSRQYVLRFDASHSLDAVRADLLQTPGVTNVWKDEIFRQANVPNDPQLGSQWWLRNPTLGGTDIRAIGGWAEAIGDTNIVVAIVDSGVDWNHPDLGGTHPDRVNGTIFTNWLEYYGSPLVDDDGNGRVDDVHGWDFVNLTQSQGYADEDMTTPDNDPSDYEGHGTACAGCASAITDNGVGVAGVARGCKVLPVRAGWLPAGETLGVVSMSYASSGMVYAANTGANIINCSWGSSSFLGFAVDYCTTAGLIIVTAAGNDNDEVASYLNTRPEVISVAATTDGDGKSSFSSYGDWIEVCAPGSNIFTTAYDRFSGNSTYASTQGTSFSSPITCGALALIWSANPGWNRQQVMDRLIGTCDDIDALNPGYEGKLGAGRINLLKALGDSFQEVGDEFEFFLDAFNEAAPGDTIAVPSTYPVAGPLVVPAKDLTVLGGWDASYSLRDPLGAPTVITANAANTALQVSGGAGPGLIIDGFRCTGGGGKFFNGIPQTGNFGGGVVLNGTSPTLRNLDVTGNTTGTVSLLGGGGGVLLYNSSAVLENVSIHDNTSIYGAGLYVSGGAPVLRDCTIADNVTFTDNGAQTPLGGGVYVVNTDLTMEGCTISGHGPVDRGGGVYAYAGGGSLALDLSGSTLSGNQAKSRGGGLYQDGGALTMLGGSVSDNAPTPDAVFMYGGGLCVENASAILDSLEVRGNTAQNGGGLFVSASPSFDLDHSVVAGNSGLFLAGAMSLQNCALADLTGDTVADNTAGSAGGGIYMTNTPATFANTLVAYNTGNAAGANGIDASGSTPSLNCCDVFGNDGNQFSFADPTGANGNISEAPLFCDLQTGDFTLMDTSPCHVDNAGACGQIGALGQGCSSGTAVDDQPGAVPAAFAVEPNYPNPFNPSTTISFALPARTHVSVKIYDVAGRLVRTLVDAVLDAQVHDAVWTGEDDGGRQVSSGVYFYRVETDADLFVSRMALLK